MPSPLHDDEYRPHLSGHETFPLRYGWLKKAFDAVCEDAGRDSSVFSDDNAISRFGVGKNMVASIRHWAIAAGVIAESRGALRPTALGQLLFEDCSGLDPWMEDPSTSWLAHWHVSGRPAQTTWFWAFSHFPGLAFERDTLVRGVADLAARREWPRASLATIRRDVGCFVRTYAPSTAPGTQIYEDALESPLAELGLIRATGKRDGFRFVRGPKPALRAGVFCYAVTAFWRSHASSANTLSFEALAHEPGSPGRVFLLDEDDLTARLTEVEDLTGGAYRWSETAGLRQLIRDHEMPSGEALAFLRADYSQAAA